MLGDGSRISADVVIAATGYDRELGEFVGRIAIVSERDLPSVHGARTHPSARRLYLIGFTNPLSGNLRELRLDAHRIARSIARSRHDPHAQPSPATELAGQATA